MTTVFRWIAFSADAAMDASDTCRRVAMDLRGQGWHRREVVGVALADFKGSYSTLLVTGCEIESADRARLTQALDTLADQIEQATAAAQREENRLEQLHQNQKRLENLALSSPELFTAPRFVDFGIPAVAPPSINVSFEAGERPRVASTHNSAGTVSAKPEALRHFASYVLGASAVMEGLLHEVEVAWSAFTSSCSWLGVGACPVIPGAQRYLEENRAEAQWIETIAAAFEHAGANGELSELEVSIAVAGMDKRYAQQLLSDKNLTPEQLKLVAEGLAKDPAMAQVVADYTTTEVNALTVNSDADQIKRATALLEGVATSPQASGALLSKLEAKGLVDRVGLSGGLIDLGHREDGVAYAEALRGVFRTGEPFLASVDPKLSRDYATALVDSVTTLERRGTTSGNDVFALSFLLQDSALSTPFLVAMGGAFERAEKHYSDGSGGWKRPEPVSDGMASLFPPEKYAAIHDPGAFYMSALATNPKAAHIFFTGGDWEEEHRIRYWLQDRQWGHDGFDGVLSAVEAASIKGGNANKPESAKLVSSMVEYLANRGQSTDNFGEKITRSYANNDQLLTGTFGKKGTTSLVKIFGTYMHSVDDAITLDEDENLDSDTQSGASSTEKNEVKPLESRVNSSISFERKDFPGVLFKDAPSFSREDLATTMQAIFRSEGGQDLMRQTVSNYQNMHFDILAQNYDGGGDSQARLQEAVRRDAQLEAFYVHQVSEASIDAGKDRDTAVGAWINVTSDALQEIPVSDLVGLHPAGRGAKVVDFLADQTFKAGEGALEESLLHNEDAAKVHEHQQKEKSLDSRRGEIIKSLYENDVIKNDRVEELAKSHSQDHKQVKKWLIEGYSPPGDPSSNDGISQSGDVAQSEVVNNTNTEDAYNRIMGQLRSDYPAIGTYETTYRDEFDKMLRNQQAQKLSNP
ncbi:MAG: hypothetical protein Q4C87_12210 [Actinomycetaceae bacterium]|nr:hypothetical protein [Actinomycetaceae bacterium]